MCEVDWAMLLEYLRVAASWPVLLFIGAMVFVSRFNSELRSLLDRIKEIKAGSMYAGLETAQQQAQAKVPLPPVPGVAPDVADQPHPVPHVGGQEPGIDWTVPADVVELLPPGTDLQAAMQWARANPGPTLRDYLLMANSLRAERSFSLIFGTQVEILEYLRLNIGDHAIADIRPYYEKHVAIVAAPQPVAVLVFLSFLMTQGLIENVGPPDGPLYRLTRFGGWFLGYIKQFYPLMWDKRPM